MEINNHGINKISIKTNNLQEFFSEKLPLFIKERNMFLYVSHRNYNIDFFTNENVFLRVSNKDIVHIMNSFIEYQIFCLVITDKKCNDNKLQMSSVLASKYEGYIVYKSVEEFVIWVEKANQLKFPLMSQSLE